MDPISLITTAIIVGIAAALKPTAEQAVKDAYVAMKTLIQDRYKLSLTDLEHQQKPASQIYVIRTSLERLEVTRDLELLKKAQELLEAVALVDASSAGTVGIDIERATIDGQVVIGRVSTEGNSVGFRARDVEIKEDLRIEQIDTKGQQSSPKA